MPIVDHANAPYARTPPKTEDSLVHSKNLSTTSSGTLFTTTSTHSHPTEPLLPLLHAATPQKVNYNDYIPANRDETIGRPPCEDPLMIQDTSMNETEKKGYWVRNCRRPSIRWKWFKLALQVVLAAWAIYNTIRYFIAFSNFGDSTNQAFCMALGTSTGVSFLFAFSSFLLAIRGRNGLKHGLKHGLTPNYLSYVRTTMLYLSSFCLLCPAVVNFILLFIFKDSVDPYFNVDNRCHLDVDLVWSVSNNLCNNKSPEWAIWFTLSVLRLVLTLILIIGFHIISYHESRRQWAIRRTRARRSKLSSPKPAPSFFKQPHRDLDTLQTDSTLCGTSRSEPSSRSQIRLASHSSSLSTDISPIESSTFSRSTTTEFENEHEIVDRFQFMESQNSQKTDEALDVAQLDHSPSPENITDLPTRELPPSYEDDWDEINDARVGHINSNNMFNLPPIFPTLGYNEFGIPYPPDRNIRVLNGYIRRMPTIESMGSGELGSSISASSNRARDSILTSSRPPTRNTLLSLNSTDYDPLDGEQPSRTNSLSARVELLVGLSSVPNNISELGELLGRTSPVARCLSAPGSYVDCTVSDTTYSSVTTGSRGTSSYHTATSKSFLSPDLSLDKRSRSPLLGQQDLLISDSGQSS